ncbi:MAG: CpaF family protein [Thiobacillus sp.]|uniref:CpaF family protein n=1 Tax=Thiobacillus sp. TaxID=924 RepID=UPI002895A5F1|nr:CpaF family protein [Thiobacillus sp.]MDT3708255.1 CpaF family protein [Thiobacillus sp.]
MSSLRDRLEQIRRATPEQTISVGPTVEEHDASAYYDLKVSIHGKLLDRIDLAALESIPEERLREELRLLVERLLVEDGVALNDTERRRIVVDIQNEVLGLGPLEPLLADTTISDILVNTYRQVYVERYGKLELTDVRFGSNAHLMKIIDRIVSRMGRRVDESSPMVDARLPDGSRVNAIIPPLALDGPLLSIRRFAVVPLKMDDLLRLKTLTPQMADILAGLVKAKVNILISGGTGSGKTTLLNVLSANIPIGERVVTIEDAAELQLQQPHVVRLETRPPNIEGKGEITQRALVRNSLRMRPDRIVIGEVRGAEVLDMLQAMNTGHDGSMTTIHANTPRDALTRMENMIGMGGLTLPPKAMRQQISSAITVVIQASRMPDGKRKVVSIQELTGMEGDIITMQEIFAYEKTGIAPDGTVLGRFKATGIRPKFVQRLKVFGIDVPDEIFDPSCTYE